MVKWSKMKNHTHVFKSFMLSLCILILTLSLALTVFAVPQLPASYYGIATINGREAPVNSVIMAKINGMEKGSIIIKEEGNKYKLN